MNKLMKLSAFVIAGVAFCGAPTMLQSCSTTQPVGEKMSDSAITAKVKAKFVGDSTVKAHNIDVNTEEGVVYLTGRVYTQAEKEEAGRIALNTEGVRKVVNHLEVGDKT